MGRQKGFWGPEKGVLVPGFVGRQKAFSGSPKRFLGFPKRLFRPNGLWVAKSLWVPSFVCPWLFGLPQRVWPPKKLFGPWLFGSPSRFLGRQEGFLAPGLWLAQKGFLGAKKVLGPPKGVGSPKKVFGWVPGRVFGPWLVG